MNMRQHKLKNLRVSLGRPEIGNFCIGIKSLGGGDTEERVLETKFSLSPEAMLALMDLYLMELNYPADEEE